MKIAVIGSGFYGSALAIILSKKNEVDLYEKKSKIFNGASSCNQFRFHSGYHYPRSQKTVNEINRVIKQIANSINIEFFNTQHLICSGMNFCSNYVNGNIISYDGSHLTRHGAEILGVSLKNVLTDNNKAND